MQCPACSGSMMYVNGGRQCSQCAHYEPGAKSPASPEPAPVAATVQDPAQATAEVVAEAANLAGQVEGLGARVVEKIGRDARTPVTNPADVERLGREWMEIVDSAFQVGSRARRFFQNLGTTLRGG